MFFDWLAAVMLLPMQMSWAVASLPGRVVGSTVVWVEGYVGQKVRREMRTAGRSSEEGRGGEKRRVPGRGQKKAI